MESQVKIHFWSFTAATVSGLLLQNGSIHFMWHNPGLKKPQDPKSN